MQSNLELVFGATNCINLDVLTLFHAKSPETAYSTGKERHGDAGVCTMASPWLFNLIPFLFRGYDFKKYQCT